MIGNEIDALTGPKRRSHITVKIDQRPVFALPIRSDPKLPRPATAITLPEKWLGATRARQNGLSRLRKHKARCGPKLQGPREPSSRSHCTDAGHIVGFISHRAKDDRVCIQPAAWGRHRAEIGQPAEIAAFRRHDIDLVVTFFGRAERQLPAIRRKTGIESRAASRSQSTSGAAIERRFPKIVLTREHNLILEDCRKTEIPSGHWFSKVRTGEADGKFARKRNRKKPAAIGIRQAALNGALI